MDTKPNAYYQFLENKRKEILKNYKSGFVKGLSYGGSLFFLGVLTTIIFGFIGIVLAFMGIVIFVVIWILQNLKINKKIRAELYTEFIKVINNKFEYKIEDNELMFEFKKSGFSPSKSNIYVDDAFNVNINGQKASFGEITAKHLQQSNYLHDFIGVFANIKTNKKYLPLTILPKNKEYRNHNSLIYKNKLKQITINDTFDQKFSVYSNDFSQTKTIVNSCLIKVLNSLPDDFNYMITFQNQAVFIGIDGFQPFRLKIRQPVDKKIADKFYKDFNFVFNLMQNIYSCLA